MVCVSPQAFAPAVSVRPSRSLAASSPRTPPIVRHSAVAAVLSLSRIMAAACVFSCAVSERPEPCAASSRAARMSTLTMLAVSYVSSPYTALSLLPVSSTATDSDAPDRATTGSTAAASTVSRSTVTSAASGVPGGDSDGGADDTARVAASGERTREYAPAATEPVGSGEKAPGRGRLGSSRGAQEHP